MRWMVRAACLSIAVLLAGCSLPHQQFSCESGLMYRTGVYDSHPATVAPDGDRHC